VKPLIDLIYVDSGSGHRAAAQAIEALAREQQRPWDFRLHGAQQLLDPIDFIRKYTGIPFEEIYNIMLRRGWTIGSAQLIPVMHLLIRMSHRQQVETFELHWRKHPVDMVVSVIPHYTRAMRQAYHRACPGRPFVTIMTDLADYPPHFWIEPQEQYLICGSERARQQALRLGMAPERVLPMSGMILHPKFHRPLLIDRAKERMRLGLRPDAPTGLIMFGGQGSMDSVRVVRALNRRDSPVQLIAICGRHQECIQTLQSMDFEIPVHIEGFTKEVPFYMGLADFFIGKPGPGSISEALAMQLPVIVERNIRTLAHERFNADWLLQRELGLVVSSFDRVNEAVEELLKPACYERLRANARNFPNTAVYDAVEWLDVILANHGVREPVAAALPTNINRRLTLA
jgi:Glycosyltransferase family 28 C-terminal domain